MQNDTDYTFFCKWNILYEFRDTRARILSGSWNKRSVWFQHQFELQISIPVIYVYFFSASAWSFITLNLIPRALVYSVYSCQEKLFSTIMGKNTNFFTFVQFENVLVYKHKCPLKLSKWISQPKVKTFNSCKYYLISGHHFGILFKYGPFQKYARKYYQWKNPDGDFIRLLVRLLKLVSVHLSEPIFP
jgi:hypothetical protein